MHFWGLKRLRFQNFLGEHALEPNRFSDIAPGGVPKIQGEGDPEGVQHCQANFTYNIITNNLHIKSLYHYMLIIIAKHLFISLEVYLREWSLFMGGLEMGGGGQTKFYPYK